VETKKVVITGMDVDIQGYGEEMSPDEVLEVLNQSRLALTAIINSLNVSKVGIQGMDIQIRKS